MNESRYGKVSCKGLCLVYENMGIELCRTTKGICKCLVPFGMTLGELVC